MEFTMKGLATISAVVVIAVVLVVALNVFVLGSVFTGSLEKVSFSNVDSFYSRGDMRIIFDDAVTVGPGDFADVMVDLDHVVIKVDSSLPGTAISASPTFGQRMRDVFIFYKAQSVTVWVKNQQEREHWENFLQTARDLRVVRENREIPYQKVLP